MPRPIAALLLGLAVAAAMLLATECLGLLLFPPPSGFPLETGEDLVRLAASAAPGRRSLMAAGWMLAAFAGGFTAARISRHHHTGMALAVGTLVAAGIALNALVLPQSPWMTLAGLLLPLPVAWLAARLATKRRPHSPEG